MTFFLKFCHFKFPAFLKSSNTNWTQDIGLQIPRPSHNCHKLQTVENCSFYESTFVYRQWFFRVPACNVLNARINESRKQIGMTWIIIIVIIKKKMLSFYCFYFFNDINSTVVYACNLLSFFLCCCSGILSMYSVMWLQWLFLFSLDGSKWKE